ncbi:MAG: hypothetical protein Harvfovirus12_20 [Harvfovirus sp.]|uniref:Uncharacterized protein n=1 Tax=Harvfovirus sp. TaxID=2487768 RepID=A0A3G5A3D6_9VIRU|nr:MAG: hypothetical protein Harvfovirus12_20 [Harvfovirus sp.]
MFIINDSGYQSKKYAIFFLCYGNDYYIMGLLCALQAHGKLLEKSPQSIELVVLCDEYINNYRPYIAEYCDRIIVIKMDILSEHHKLYKAEKYAKKWMDAIINKWHCLYFEEYKKVLLSDIDILPTNSVIYDIFTKYEEPYMFGCRKFSGCAETIYYGSLPNRNFKDYYDYVANGNFFIDGGFALFTPNKTYHDEYFDFVQTIDVLSMKSVGQRYSGIDEITIYYFLVHIKKVTYNCFQESDTAVIPWKTNYGCANMNRIMNKIKRTSLFNYLSTVKPFIKPIPLMWREEYIWKILERDIISGSPFLKALSIRNALYCYLYLNTRQEASLEIIKKNNQFNIINFIKKLTKEMSLTDPVFDHRAYQAISSSEEKLLSYKDQLNLLNGDADIVNECCGLIKKEQYRSLF